jgi:hypothetical protein
MKAPTLALSLAALSGTALAQPAPAVVVRPQGIVLRELPAVLSEAVVARHLDTGLTTTLAFTVDAGRAGERRLQGAAQVHIRYDLWDERYLVDRWDARPDSPVHWALERPQLERWWHSLELLVVPGATPPALAARKTGVDLQVLPFSQAEQRDAQDWLRRALRERDPPPRSGGETGPGANAPVRELYGAMLASSIGRRSLITYSWTVPIVLETR